MGMKVGNSLPRRLSLVDNQPVALSESLLLRNYFRRVEDMLVVSFVGESCKSCRFLARNNQNMRRGLGLDVPESHHMLILVYK